MPFLNSDTSNRLITKTRVLRFASIVLLGLSFVAIYAFNIVQVGDSMEWKDGKATISAGSHPAILAWDAVAIALFVKLMLMETSTTVAGVPTRRRRFLAFLIDFWFSIAALSGIGALVPLWLEAARTGQFKWHFHREYAVSSDAAYALPSSLVFLILIILYFVVPLTRGKQTVGCFIMRLKVTPPFGDRGRFTFREALKRTYYEFVGLCSVLSRKWDEDDQGRSWYDRRTNCTVVIIADN